MHHSSTQSCVDLVQHRRARAEVLLTKLIERLRLVRVEVGVEIFSVGGEVEKAGEDFAGGGGLCDRGLGDDFVGGVVVAGELAELDDGAVVLRDGDGLSIFI